MSVKVKFFKIEYVKDIEVTKNSGVVLTVKKYEVSEVSDEMWNAIVDIGDWFDALSEDGDVVILDYIDPDVYREWLEDLILDGEQVDEIDYKALDILDEWINRGIDYVVLVEEKRRE